MGSDDNQPYHPYYRIPLFVSVTTFPTEHGKLPGSPLSLFPCFFSLKDEAELIIEHSLKLWMHIWMHISHISHPPVAHSYHYHSQSRVYKLLSVNDILKDRQVLFLCLVSSFDFLLISITWATSLATKWREATRYSTYCDPEKRLLFCKTLGNQ